MLTPRVCRTILKSGIQGWRHRTHPFLSCMKKITDVYMLFPGVLAEDVGPQGFSRKAKGFLLSHGEDGSSHPI